MKSDLRFKFNREECLRILKEVTNETRTSALFSNFSTILKDNIFYGEFFPDNTFEIQPTTYARGTMGQTIKGEIKEMDEEGYKCRILVESKMPKGNLFVLLILFIITVLVGEFLFIAACMILGFFLIANTTYQTKKAINTIIDTIEGEY